MSLSKRDKDTKDMLAPEEVKQDTTEKTQSPPAQPVKPVAEKQTNCLSCNKPIIKLKRYYRDGKFYCSKKCWRDYITKSKGQEKK